MRNENVFLSNVNVNWLGSLVTWLRVVIHIMSCVIFKRYSAHISFFLFRFQLLLNYSTEIRLRLIGCTLLPLYSKIDISSDIDIRVK